MHKKIIQIQEGAFLSFLSYSLPLSLSTRLQIPLVRDVRDDPRAAGAAGLLVALAALVLACGAGARTRPPVLACVAFTAWPFALAANVVVVTGTTVGCCYSRSSRMATLVLLSICYRG
jgi:hypothetical protein